MCNRNRLGALLLAALLLTSCGNDNPASKTVAGFVPPLVDLPLKTEVIPFTYYTIDAATGGSFRTGRGSEVSFPADAFVFEDGSAVTEPVTIQFREYHSAAEILLSGIYMVAKDEQGQSHPFESAGMFEMDGKAGNRKVKIAKGKNARVSLANDKADPDFNFYRMDENGWTELQKNLKPTENSVPENVRKEAEKPTGPAPVEPQKVDEKSFVFDMDLDTYRYPELQELYGVMWQYDGEKGGSADPESNPKITEGQWPRSSILRSDDGRFTLQLRNKTEKIDVPVKPVLSGKNYAEAKARFDKKMANYNAALQRQKDFQKEMEEQAKFVRTFEVAGFGTYNCDRFYNTPDVQRVAARYQSGGSTLPSGTILFHIAKDDVVIRLYNATEELPFSRAEKNRILAIFPDQTVGLVNAAEFASTTGNGLREVEFNIKKLPVKDITPEKLTAILRG